MTVNLVASIARIWSLFGAISNEFGTIVILIELLFAGVKLFKITVPVDGVTVPQLSIVVTLTSPTNL